MKSFSSDRPFFAVIITSCLFIWILVQHFTKEDIKSDKDLKKVSGNFKEYSFVNKGAKRLYYLWLDGYACTFQISADNLQYFKKDSFITEIKKGDSLYLAVSNNNALNLNRDTEISIFDLRKWNTVYLDKDDTIALENKNTDTDIYEGFGFVVFALVGFLIKAIVDRINRIYID
jgi:hypothetical protein